MTTFAVHLRLIGKLIVDFLLVIIELFSLGVFVLSQCTRLTDRQTDGQTDVDSKTVRMLGSRTVKSILGVHGLWVLAHLIASVIGSTSLRCRPATG